MTVPGLGIKLNYRGMAAGAAAFNPGLRRYANTAAGGGLSVPMAGMRLAGVGAGAGTALDVGADKLLGYDTGGAFARTGAWGGVGLGAMGQGAHVLKQRGINKFYANGANRNTIDLGTGNLVNPNYYHGARLPYVPNNPMMHNILSKADQGFAAANKGLNNFGNEAAMGFLKPLIYPARALNAYL